MTVTKDTIERYRIRANHEWASIMVSCWERKANVGTKHEGIYYCGEITIQSSFGSWGYTWTACAEPFKEFLVHAEFGYMFTKFMGTKLRRYDGHATMQQIKRDIIEQRLLGSVSQAGAREAWDAVSIEVDRIEHGNETDMGYAMFDVARVIDKHHPMRDYFADASGWPRITNPDDQAVGFWRELWPAFVDALRAEVTGKPAQPPQAA